MESLWTTLGLWDSFQNCLSRLDHMLQRCEDTNLSLNWEKSHFMVKEGIVLGHKISKKGIEVDKAKIDVIAKLPHPTTVKGIRSFLEPVSWADFANYHAVDFVVKGMSTLQKNKVLQGRETLFLGTDRLLVKICADQVIRRCVPALKLVRFLSACNHGPPGDIMVLILTAKKVFDSGFFWPHHYKEATSLSRNCDSRENRAPGRTNLDDALNGPSAQAYKTPIGVYSYKLVYGKACHLPIEHEHKKLLGP
ncbi:hypothetical protein Tco_0388578 [Tanacetum coccineum]